LYGHYFRSLEYREGEGNGVRGLGTVGTEERQKDLRWPLERRWDGRTINYCYTVIFISSMFSFSLFLIVPVCYAYTTAPSLRDVYCRLPSGVVHLLSSPWDLFAVSVFPCYPKEMRCDWSRRLIAIDFFHVEYLHSFAIQLGNRNFFNISISVGGVNTVFFHKMLLIR